MYVQRAANPKLGLAIEAEALLKVQDFKRRA